MLFTTLLAAALLHSPVPQARTPVPPSGTNTSEATAEGVEILRRIVVETLDQALEVKPEKGHSLAFRHGFQTDGLVTTLWAGGRAIQHSRAFHLPEVGIFLTLDASLPVVTKEKDERGAGDSPTNDEWERTRRELRGSWSSEGGGLFRRRFVQPEVAGEIDPKAIEQVIDLVLRTLARHVSRIEGLAPNEAVTVAVRLSGRNRTWVQDFEPSDFDVFSPRDERRERMEDEEEGEDGGTERTLSAYVVADGHEAREQNLVLRITVADLAGVGEDSPERLRQRAQVNRY